MHVGVVVDRGRARDVVGLHDQARGAARTGPVGDGARLHGHVPRHARSSDRRRRRPITARVRIERRLDDLGVYAPAISTFPNFPSGIGTPSVHTGVLHDVYLTLVSSPTRDRHGHARRAGRPDGDVAVDRRRDHGARHRRSRSMPARRRAAASSPTRAGPTTTNRAPLAEVVDVMRHRARAGSRSAVGVVLVAFGVVLAVQHRDEPSVPRLVQRARAGARVRPHDARRQAARRSPTSRARPYVVNFWNSLVHPVPAGGARARKRSTTAHKDEPDFAMVGIVRDDDARRRSATTSTREQRRRGRSRSTRRARPRSASARPASPRRT